jgi:hypothetical protein
MTGKPFSKPVTLGDDTPSRIREWSGDIDLQGRDLHAFAADLCASALAYGIAGILVDFPKTRNLPTVADERAAGVRPYFVQIAATDILGWRAERINGAEVLTQLRLMETAVEPDGDFGEKETAQVRVLSPGAWQIWRKKPETNEWVLFDEGKTTIQRIPFVPIYGRRTGFMTGTAPLMELAHLNVEHWQSKSDQQTILHVARVPILFLKGFEATVTVGAGSAVSATDPGADMKYVEHTGAAIEAGRRSLIDLEDLMRQVGAELLVIKPGNMTVKQTVADNEPAMCTLQRIVQDLEDSVENALGLMAEWVGEATDQIEAKIFQDFGVTSLGEAAMSLLRGMNVDGTFSDESLFLEAQRRGLIRPEIAWDDEKSRIASNVPKQGAKLTD